MPCKSIRVRHMTVGIGENWPFSMRLSSSSLALSWLNRASHSACHAENLSEIRVAILLFLREIYVEDALHDRSRMGDNFGIIVKIYWAAWCFVSVEKVAAHFVDALY